MDSSYSNQLPAARLLLCFRFRVCIRFGLWRSLFLGLTLGLSLNLGLFFRRFFCFSFRFSLYFRVHVSLHRCLNAPTKDKPFNRMYTVQYLGNVVGGQPVRYLNVDIETMKRAAKEMIVDGHPVWFGCDSSKMANRELGVYDLSGRLVKKLLSGSVEAGQREVHWDGRDVSGAEVASGIYFCNLATDGDRETLKITVLR